MVLVHKRWWLRGQLFVGIATIAALAAVVLPQQSDADEPTAAVVSHGEQLQRADLGPQGALTQRSGFTTSATTTLSNVQINGGVQVRHDFTCTDCRIVGTPSATAAGYTVKVTSSTGQKFRCIRCEIITRSAVTKGIVSYGNAGIWLERSIVRGGEDNYYGKPSTRHFTVDGVGYGHVFIESMFTDVQRHSGSHSDSIQVDGGSGGVLILRSKIQSYALPAGSDPLTTAADGSQLGSGGVILTYPSTNPQPISRVHLRDNWFDGGNQTVDLSPPDGPAPTDVVITGNKWGLKHRFAALHGPRGSNNRWGLSGQTICNGRTITVVDEQPLSC
jgi:hypothetical protein